MGLSLEIFLIFFRLGLISFGGVFGVLPELERQIVIERGWVDADRFVQAYVMGQFVPGPNMAMCAILGYWVNGVSGAIAAFAGIYSGPLLVIGAAYAFYRRWRDSEIVRRSERAMRPVVLGLMVASLARLWWIQGGREALPGAVFSLCVIGIGAYAYRKKWLGSLSLIFACGALWYAGETLLHAIR